MIAQLQCVHGVERRVVAGAGKLGKRPHTRSPGCAPGVSIVYWRKMSLSRLGEKDDEGGTTLPYLEHFLLEAIKFAAFAFVCGCLMRFRFKRKTMVLTLLPVTAYLPAILAVHLLSGSGFLPTVSVWSAGLLLSLTLLFLQRLLNLWLPHHAVAAVLAAAAALCALAFRCLRRPYRAYVLENQSGWLLLSFPAVMLFLLFSYWADTVTDPVLFLLLRSKSACKSPLLKASSRANIQPW